VGAGELRGSSETILFVEDQDSLRGTACRILRKFGYSVIEATNGTEALKEYRARRAEIDLVVTDLIMPDMGGRGLLRAVRTEGGEVPFLVTTGYTGREAEGRAELDPDVPLIHKPWTLEELVRAVRDVLDAERA
jgi:CheY-like chemotaxis protein